MRHSATLIPPRDTSDGEDIRLGIGLDILTIAQLAFAARNAAGFWRPANLTCYFTRRHSVNPSILNRKTGLLGAGRGGPHRCVYLDAIDPPPI